MKLVSIVLDSDDDAQIIFETLNGRGAQLHATDLIRNYVFMRADRERANSEVLYNNLWSAFESAYWSEEQRRGRMKKPRLEWLIHSALQAELHEEVDLSRLYHEYRRFVMAGNPAIAAEQQLLTLADYATHYKELVSGAGSTPIARFGLRIANYDVTTLYPLALMIATSSVSDADKTEIYDDLVSYLVRRTICGLTSKNYNNVFLSVLRQLHAAGISPAALRTILQASTGDASRWPDDGEFKNACLTAPLYPGRLDPSKAKGMLAELEGGLISNNHTEDKSISGLPQLDVDHILPQSWYTYWPLADGSAVSSSEGAEVEFAVRSGLSLDDRQGIIAKRQDCISNLGNLTLLNLSVNRQVQHHSFTAKRNLLIANTNLRLNIPLIVRTTWDEDAIIERGQQLASIALQLWLGPR